MLHLALVRRIDHLFADELMLVVVVATTVLKNLVVDPRKDARPVVVIVLRPAIKWMIVALRTLETGAEEQLRRGNRARHGIAVGPIIIRRRIEIAAAAPANQFTHELIHRLVARDALTNPLVKGLHAFPIQNLLLVLQQIRPFHRPKIGELGTFEQLIHEPRALALASVGDKGTSFVSRRQLSQQIEKRPPHKLVVGAQPRGIHPQRLKFGKDLIIDEIVGRHLLPGEAKTCRNESQPHRNLLIQKTHDHRGLARSVRVDQSIMRNRDDRLSRIVNREARDIAGGSVGEKGAGGDFHINSRSDENFLCRRDFDPRQGRHRVRITPGTIGDPTAKNSVFDRVGGEATSTFVGELRGGLQENQTLIRLGDIDPATK